MIGWKRSERLRVRHGPAGALTLGLSLLLCATSVLAGPTSVTHPPVRLASLDWEPYIGASLPQQGYVAELMRRVYADRGYTVEITLLPWARALHMAQLGQFDGLMPEYFDASRQADFVYSDPFPGGPVGLYKRTDRPLAYSIAPNVDMDGAMRGLQGLKIGVVRGYLNTPAFDNAPGLTREDAVSDAANLRKLFFGRVDLIFIDQYVAEFLIRRDLPSYAGKLELMQPALENKFLYVAFSRRAGNATGELRDEFNRGLATLTANGELLRLRQSFGFDLPVKPNPEPNAPAK